MKEVTVTFPSGKQRNIPYGTRTSELIKDSEFDSISDSLIATMVNNEPTSLSFKIEINSFLKPITLDTQEGIRVYRRSLCFLLAKAAHEVFPARRLIIGHSLGEGYYYYFDDQLPFKEKDLSRLSKRMLDLVQQDLPIKRQVVSYVEALKFFKEKGQNDTLLLIESQNANKIPVYVCNDFLELSYGPLAPCTGILKSFELMLYTNGFLLRYPGSTDPLEVAPFKDSPLLFSVYQEYKAWGKILGVNSVGRLNELINTRSLNDFIRVAEALHNKKIAEIADKIHEKKGKVKVILAAGPSSSGKTTFTKKLSIQLRVLGFNPVVISLDNYFVARDLTPVDAEGNYDFESIKAIDITLLNEHILALFKGEEVEIPDFDFRTGGRKPEGNKLRISDRSILIMEGIHGLNEALTPRIPREMKYKIYVSALTQLNLDDHNRIPTTDNRLLRRMVRDSQFRSYSALETLKRWPSVRRGEKLNIFPYQEEADSAFNSALDYELSVLKVYAEPLLRSVKPYHILYSEANRLLTFLSNLTPVPPGHVPDDSILREFIGDSGFKY